MFCARSPSNPHLRGIASRATSMMSEVHDEEDVPSLRSMLQDFLPPKGQAEQQKKEKKEPEDLNACATPGCSSQDDPGLLRDRSMFWRWVHERNAVAKMWTRETSNDMRRRDSVRGPPLHAAPWRQKM